MSEWISVEDRLPEINKDVLCMVNKFRCVCFLNIYNQWEANEAVETNYDMAEVVLFDKVTHWMPLPEPPESDTMP